MKLLPSLVLILSLILFYMCSSDVTGTNDESVTGTKAILLVGKVLDEKNNGVSNVVVKLHTTGFSDTTDSSGIFNISAEKDSIEKLGFNLDTLNDTLKYTRNNELITSVKISNWIDTLPDVYIVQRNVSGSLLTSYTQFKRIEAVLSDLDDTTADQKTADLWLSMNTFKFSGYLYFLNNYDIKNYSLYVNVYDKDSIFIGRSTTENFPSTAGDIEFAPFDPFNARPKVNILGDISVSVNDTIKLSASVVDDFGGYAAKWEWDIGNTGTYIESTDSTFFAIAPSIFCSSYCCIVKVTDNDGNIAYDTTGISVLTDIPNCSASTTTPFVSINDSIKLIGSAFDEYGFIEKWEWKIGDSDWLVTSKIDTIIIAPSIAQFYLCSLRVTDDDGYTAYDKIEIAVGHPILTDASGNEYRTIVLGNQMWTIDNLRTTNFNDGSEIPYYPSNSPFWLDDSLGAYCYYDDDSASNASKYGALYNWHAVNTDKLAPKGWHVPTNDDWEILMDFLILSGYNYDNTTSGNKIAKAMASKIDWISSDSLGAIGNMISLNNSSGFSATPAGYRSFASSFWLQGNVSYWWSDSEFDSLYANFYRLEYDNKSLIKSYREKGWGYSVRIVRD